MRKLAGLAVVIVISVCAQANAQVCTDGAAPDAQTPCRPCGCQKATAPAPALDPLVLEPMPAQEPPSPAEVAAQRDLISTVALGAVLFTAGQAIAIAHYALSDQSSRAFDFVPIVGPGVVAVHYRTPDWTSPLVFASWLQAAGVIVAASAGYALSQTKVQVGASVSPGNASVELGTRF